MSLGVDGHEPAMVQPYAAPRFASLASFPHIGEHLLTALNLGTEVSIPLERPLEGFHPDVVFFKDMLANE